MMDNISCSAAKFQESMQFGTRIHQIYQFTSTESIQRISIESISTHNLAAFSYR